MAFSKMKEFAKSGPNELPCQIMGKFLMELQNESISKIPAPDQLKKTLCNKKRANLPPFPANLGSITFPDNLI